MKCFYHSADLDGHCSGAIARHTLQLTDEEMFPINYGQELPWNKIQQDEIIYMLDFCLQPLSDMQQLSKMCSALIWIDHHQVINEPGANLLLGYNFRRVGAAGCELAWGFFCPDTPIPEAVYLLGRYDVWDHSNPNTLPFQYGLRLENTFPTSENMWLWTNLFQDKYVEDYIRDGKVILKYEAETNSKFCKSYTFETELRVPVGILGSSYGVPAICVNKGFTNSQVFDSVWNPEKYDVMITFCRLPLPAEKWTVSLYSDKPDVDCAELAKQFGGGGHKEAAGFQCTTLPFKH